MVCGVKKNMGRLRERINRSSDSYYVGMEGYKEAKIRQSNQKFVLGFMLLVFMVGMGFLTAGFQLARKSLTYIGIGFFVLGMIIAFLFRRFKDNE